MNLREAATPAIATLPSGAHLPDDLRFYMWEKARAAAKGWTRMEKGSKAVLFLRQSQLLLATVPERFELGGSLFKGFVNFCFIKILFA